MTRSLERTGETTGEVASNPFSDLDVDPATLVPPRTDCASGHVLNTVTRTLVKAAEAAEVQPVEGAYLIGTFKGDHIYVAVKDTTDPSGNITSTESSLQLVTDGTGYSFVGSEKTDEGLLTYQVHGESQGIPLPGGRFEGTDRSVATTQVAELSQEITGKLLSVALAQHDRGNIITDETLVEIARPIIESPTALNSQSTRKIGGGVLGRVMTGAKDWIARKTGAPKVALGI